MQSDKLISRTLCQDLDAAIMIVAYPSGDAQRVGLAFDEPAEADALHAAADQVATGLNRFFSRSHPRNRTRWYLNLPDLLRRFRWAKRREPYLLT